MKWIFDNALRGFESARNEWSALNRLHGNHVLLDPQFVGLLLRHFGNTRVLLGTCQDNSCRGMALVVQERTGLWSTYQPSQSPVGLIVLDSNPWEESTLSLLRSLPGYALQLSILQQDTLYSALRTTCLSPRAEILEYIKTSSLSLDGTFEAYWAGRGKNLRHNLERQKRKLREQGHVTELRAVSDAGEVALCIRNYGRLETTGWKGEQGTAVSENNNQGRFYRDVLEHFCALGEGLIFEYLLNGQVVASDLCLTRNGMLIVLKTAYDETLKGFSPALLMRQEALEYLYRKNSTRVIEFYGPVKDWHTKWTDQIRSIYHINMFRHAFIGSALKILKRLRQ